MAMHYAWTGTEEPKIGGIRWADECASAARFAGWEPVETVGEEDYQGWGVHLLRRVKDEADAAVARDAEIEGRTGVLRDRAWTWGVMSWGYGSCSGCDEYEGRVPINATPEQCHTIFGELIETADSEEAARRLMDSRKGW